MNFLKIFLPSDPELIQKTLSRLAEQDTWNDVFSTKLIELLDKIDRIKSEIRLQIRKADERFQRAESLTIAESTLLEQAAEASQLNARLVSTEEALATAKRDFQIAKDGYRDSAKLRTEADEVFSEAELRYIEAKATLTEATAQQQSATELASRDNDAFKSSVDRLSESRISLDDAQIRLEDAKTVFAKATERLQKAEQLELEAAALAKQAKQASDEASGKQRIAQIRCEEARIREEHSIRRSRLVIAFTAN